ncbi:MAG TPA: ABC transporter substrate-binding protein [Acidisphaera sp.]|nr:ABC transporter substrate-binding protein [Acidisphaera sp.]
MILNRRSALALGAAALALRSVSARAQGADIVVGAPNALSGGYGEGGRQVVNGLRIAVDEINAGGGIKALQGRKLKLSPADTSSDKPAQAASVTRRLITEDHASVLVGAHVSTMTLAAQLEAERAEVPIITTSYADSIVSKGYKYTFKIPPQSSVLSAAGLDDIAELYQTLKHEPVKRLAVFYGSDANSQAIGSAYLDLAKKRGIDVVASAALPSPITDPTPVIAPLRQSNPQVIILNLFTDDTILTARALRNLGIMAPLIGSGSGVTVKAIPEALGKQADNLMGTVAWNSDLPIKGVAEFDAAYKKAYPSEPLVPQEAGEGYAIGLLIGQALENAASDDPKKIRDAIAAIDMPAILPGGRIQFAENGQNKDIVPLLVGWKDGVLHTLWPSQYATAQPSLP